MKLNISEERELLEKNSREYLIDKKVEDLLNESKAFVTPIIIDLKPIELIKIQKQWPFTFVDIDWNIISDNFVDIEEKKLYEIIKIISADDDLKNKKIFIKSKYWKLVKKFNNLNQSINNINEGKWVDDIIDWYKYHYLSSEYKKIKKDEKIVNREWYKFNSLYWIYQKVTEDEKSA